jgi:predicted secreted protein
MKRPAIILLGIIFFAGALSAEELPGFSDPDKPITIPSGSVFVITLDSNRTAGYEWQISKPFDKYAFESIGVEYVNSAGGLVGAGGKENWTFRALGSRNGKLPIVFKYVRPWEKDVEPVRVITFTVTITKGPAELQVEHMQRELDKMHDVNLNPRLGE